MLQSPTPFPHVGSYALLVDEDAPAPQPTELVRIQWRREGEYVVAFPLRDGAGGTKRVDPAALIDGSPLTDDERREEQTLSSQLSTVSLRTLKQKRMKARRDALRDRIRYAPILARLLREAQARADWARAA